MTLVIAEKPSVARDIAKVLGATGKRDGYLEGSGYQVTWCVGHLVQLAAPESYGEEYKRWRIDTLPILPQSFKKEVPPETKKQFMIVSSLIKQNDEIICATDAGREGQLIFEYVFRLSAKPEDKQTKRLWISSMTDEAIADGFAHLKDNHDYERLYQSARCRSEADWLVGMNFTRLFTVKYGTKLTVGRVQTPTLALIVERQKAIEQFVPSPYFQLEGRFGALKAMWSRGNTNRLDTREQAEALKKQLTGQIGTVTKLETNRKQEDRPQLFDLTELQREANRRFGYTAQDTLSAAQSLYETHKLLTYPRTDSRCLSDDMKPEIPGLLKKMAAVFPEGQPFIADILQKGPNLDKRVVNNSKVTDHHAIIVTNRIHTYQPDRLTQRENNILRLVMTRLIVALSAKKIYDETKLEIAVGAKDLFKATGKKIISEGWSYTERFLLGKPVNEDDAEEDDTQLLGDVQKGQQLPLDEVHILEKKTTAPKPYTEATLLTAMEKASREVDDKLLKDSLKDKGLGTPATRAAIIERLIAVGYVERKKKNLLPTEQGTLFIQLVPESIKQVELTAQWEKRLSDICDGQEDPQHFMADIRQYVSEVVTQNASSEGQRAIYRGGALREIIGKCPRCGKNIFENDKSFYCEGYRDDPKCTFSLWKDSKYWSARGITFTKEMAQNLLKDGSIRIDGLRSKAGNLYNGIFYMDLSGPYVNFRMEFAPRNDPPARVAETAALSGQLPEDTPKP